ncbi:MAG: hypothetical protein B6241_10185 [Spirochaetaceae bacterium 4572_59]|nr:MAG: hypothetical protein B6241_10185 [Spirochaetaceae bacterium 4572_59]
MDKDKIKNQLKARRKYRIITLAVVFPIIIGSQFLKKDVAELKEELPVRPAKVMVLQDEELSIRRVFPGRVHASQNIDLTFDVPGRLLEFPIKEGQTLEKGDLVARLEPNDYLSRMNAARAQFEKAELDLNRSIELFDNELIAPARLEIDKVNYNVAKANYDTTVNAYNNTFIYAPYDGMVSKKYVNEFVQLAPNQPIINYQSLNKLDIQIDVPETYLSYLANPKFEYSFTAQFSNDMSREFDLEIKEYSTIADLQTKTYSGTFTMDRPEDLAVLSGMTVTVNMELRQKEASEENSFYIPSKAIIYNVTSQKSMVWVVQEDMSVTARFIETGDLTADNIEVHDGLEKGETIVIAGANQLFEGQIVRLYVEE